MDGKGDVRGSCAPGAVRHSLRTNLHGDVQDHPKREVLLRRRKSKMIHISQAPSQDKNIARRTSGRYDDTSN